MAIMNAEVTAENRPDSLTGQPHWLCGGGGTHENERGIQIFVMFLLKVFIVFSDFLFELVVEAGPGVRTTVPLQYRLQGDAQSLF